MKPIVRNIIVYTLLVLTILLIAGLGYFVISYLRSRQHIQLNQWIQPKGNKLQQIMQYIERNYVDSLSDSDLQEQMLPYLFRQLDPHSEYIPSTQLARIEEPMNGSFDGIGVSFTMLADTIVVENVIANGPAQKAGIVAGDRIHTIGQDTVAGHHVPQDSIMGRLRGERGTEVEVGVQRDNSPELIHFRIVRDRIPINSVEAYYMADSVTGVVRLARFSKTTAQDFQMAILNLVSKGMDRIVLDLRGNAGGYLEMAHFLAGQFLNSGDTIAYTEGRARPRSYLISLADGALRNIPLVVLIDEFTASSSEIVAGAIQDNDRGLIVGRRSFGKGLVQEQIVLTDGSAIRLTTQRYYTPSGRLIQKPYQLGKSDAYDEELASRWAHGELLEKDSVQQDTTQRYFTHAGRPVYGGGGIMPDFFVGIDTADHGEYFKQLNRRFLQIRFTQSYLNSHRKELLAHGSTARMIEHLKNEQLFEQLVSYTQRMGVKPPTPRERELSQEVLTSQIYAYLARCVYGNEDFYPILQRYDPVMQKALTLLHDPDAMRMLRRPEVKAAN